MLAAERQRRILDLAKREGTVRTTELAGNFGVTEETIRRDLDFLARIGRLRRSHGGAVDAAVELPQSERATQQLDEKLRMAKAAAELIQERETLLLDASTTVVELASVLPRDFGLKVVTYSLAVVERLAAREDLKLIQLGGTFDRRGRRFHGLLTEMGLRSLRIDRFFFSGGGFDPARGVGEPNPDQARLKRAMVEHAAWSCALLDHTKLGAPTDHFFARPEDLDALVTDKAGKAFAKTHLKNVSYSLHFCR